MNNLPDPPPPVTPGMSPPRRVLVVVAHPDDETLWFGGTIRQAVREGAVVDVVVAASRGLSAARAEARLTQLRTACGLLGTRSPTVWGLTDAPLDRLDDAALEGAAGRTDWGRWDEVLTHGPAGEYGHPHHQDVGAAVHRAAEAWRSRTGRPGPVVWSPAYQTLAARVHVLPAGDFARKCHILSRIYSAEYYGFVHLLPAGSVEALSCVDPREAALVAAYLRGERTLTEVRAAARPLPTPHSHPWLGDPAVAPPLPQTTYGLMTAADELTGSLNPWSGGPPDSVDPPERVPVPRPARAGTGLLASLRRLTGL